MNSEGELPSSEIRFSRGFNQFVHDTSSVAPPLGETDLHTTSASRWDWLDFDAEESKQVRDFIRHEVEGEGLDPLRLGAAVRDRIAEILFPGTSTQYRRLRYVILSAAMLRKKGASIGTLAQSQAMLNAELDRANPGEKGIIGRRSREREFLHLHWTAVRKWEFLTHIVDERDLTVEIGLAALQARSVPDEEGGSLVEPRVRWNPKVVKLLDDFWDGLRKGAKPSIHCTSAEVKFILGQWLELPEGPALAAMAAQVGRQNLQSKAIYPWEVSIRAYKEAARDLNRAKAVSLICWGAQLAYNFALLRYARKLEKSGADSTWQASGRGLEGTTAKIEDYYKEWLRAFNAEQRTVASWTAENHWEFLGNGVPRSFLAGTALLLQDGGSDLKTSDWTAWVKAREKKANPRPKLSDREYLATWSGKPEMARRWDFRWGSCVRHFIADAENPRG